MEMSLFDWLGYLFNSWNILCLLRVHRYVIKCTVTKEHGGSELAFKSLIAYLLGSAWILIYTCAFISIYACWEGAITFSCPFPLHSLLQFFLYLIISTVWCSSNETSLVHFKFVYVGCKSYFLAQGFTLCQTFTISYSEASSLLE